MVPMNVVRYLNICKCSEKLVLLELLTEFTKGPRLLGLANLTFVKGCSNSQIFVSHTSGAEKNPQLDGSLRKQPAFRKVAT